MNGVDLAPEMRVPVCSAAVRAAALGGVFAVAADASLWHFACQDPRSRQRIVEAGTTSAPQDYFAAAERAAAILAVPRDRLVMVSVTGAIRPESEPAIDTKALGNRAIAVAKRISSPDVLELGDNYETFIARLGYETRKSMRRFPARARKAGFQFAFSQTLPSPDEAGERHTLGAATGPVPKSRARLESLDAFLAKQPRPFCSTIRLASGGQIGFLAGFLEGDDAIVTYQLNHRDYRKESLSTVNRSICAEQLIAIGIRRMIFPNGCNGILRASCARRQWVNVVLVPKTLRGYLSAALLVWRNPGHPASQVLRPAIRQAWQSWRT